MIVVRFIAAARDSNELSDAAVDAVAAGTSPDCVKIRTRVAVDAPRRSRCGRVHSHATDDAVGGRIVARGVEVLAHWASDALVARDTEESARGAEPTHRRAGRRVSAGLALATVVPLVAACFSYESSDGARGTVGRALRRGEFSRRTRRAMATKVSRWEATDLQ